MAGSLSTINIKFFADLKQFSSQMQNANRQLQKHGKQITAVGKNMSIGLTAPILLMGAASLKAFDTQAQSIAQVEAGIKSTGSAAGYTSEQLQKMASDLQNKTIFGDEEILKSATAQLLTFTNIASEQFARAQVAALDLATRLDGDLKSASIMLGKALNDPLKGLAAMGKAGIQFSEDQKKTITALVKTNHLAEAQTLILNELGKQYGGSAEAAAKAGLGGITQLGNILGDVSEDFGKIISEALTPFIAKIKEWALAFKDLSEPTKKTIVVVAALAAAIGPLLIALGFMMTTVIPGLITAYGFLTAAVTATGSAFASLNAFMLANPVVAIAAGIAAITYGLISLIQAITPAVSKLKTLFNLIRSGGNAMLFTNYQLADQYEAMNEQNIAAKAAAAATKAFEDKQKLAAIAAGKLTDELKKQAAAEAERIRLLALGGGRPKPTKVFSIPTITSLAIPIKFNTDNLDKSDDMWSKINDQIKAGSELITVPPIAARITEELVKAQAALIEFNMQAKDIIKGALTDTFVGLGEVIGDALANGGNVLQAAGQVIIKSLGSVLVQFGKLIIAAGIASETFSKMMKNPFGGGIAAIAAGIALVVIGSAIGSFANKKTKNNSYAEGGIVGGNSYYGDKIMSFLNSGEGVFNKNQMKTIYNGLQGGNNVQYVPYILRSEVQGNHLKFVLKQQDKLDLRTK